MQTDISILIQRNREINDAENRADVSALDKYLASELAFRRRDGKIVGRATFLSANPGDRIIQIESVHLYGNRAVVTCLVTTSAAGATHNVRLFVKENSEWKIIGWANEPV